MGMVNIRLTDAEHARLKELAGDGSVSDLLRRWIAQGVTSHAACDRRIAELEAAARVAVPIDFLRDNNSMTPNVTVEITRAKPDFLAAPDDDCGSCGHDRQQWHLDGSCRFPNSAKVSRKCGCETFVSAAEPF